MNQILRRVRLAHFSLIVTTSLAAYASFSADSSRVAQMAELAKATALAENLPDDFQSAVLINPDSLGRMASRWFSNTDYEELISFPLRSSVEASTTVRTWPQTWNGHSLESLRKHLESTEVKLDSLDPLSPNQLSEELADAKDSFVDVVADVRLTNLTVDWPDRACGVSAVRKNVAITVDVEFTVVPIGEGATRTEERELFLRGSCSTHTIRVPHEWFASTFPKIDEDWRDISMLSVAEARQVIRQGLGEDASVTILGLSVKTMDVGIVAPIAIASLLIYLLLSLQYILSSRNSWGSKVPDLETLGWLGLMPSPVAQWLFFVITAIAPGTIAAVLVLTFLAAPILSVLIGAILCLIGGSVYVASSRLRSALLTRVEHRTRPRSGCLPESDLQRHGGARDASLPEGPLLNWESWEGTQAEPVAGLHPHEAHLDWIGHVSRR